MADTNRRVPLWAVALVGGMGVLTILGLFIYGSYSGLDNLIRLYLAGALEQVIELNEDIISGD
eukprot:gene14240-16595_t